MKTRPNATLDLVRVEMLVPRSALVAVIEPDMISQRNVLAAEGIPPRLYLETLRRPDFDVPITPLGKLRLVERAPFVAWLKARALIKPAVPMPAAPVPDDAPPELDVIDRALIQAGGRLVIGNRSWDGKAWRDDRPRLISYPDGARKKR